MSEYTRLSEKHLQEAEALLGQGAYDRASEKFWQAAAAMARAAADAWGWPHDRDRDLYRVISRLVQETGQQELIDWFSLAGHLHTNFYEDWLPPDQVTRLAASVRQLLDELRRLARA